MLINLSRENGTIHLVHKLQQRESMPSKNMLHKFWQHPNFKAEITGTALGMTAIS